MSHMEAMGPLVYLLAQRVAFISPHSHPLTKIKVARASHKKRHTSLRLSLHLGPPLETIYASCVAIKKCINCFGTPRIIQLHSKNSFMNTKIRTLA
jgi:hypothetical protein